MDVWWPGLHVNWTASGVNPKMEGTPVTGFAQFEVWKINFYMDFVVGRYILIQNIWDGDPHPKKDHTFRWTLHKDMDEGSLCSLPAALPCWEVPFFTDLSAYFFGVVAYTEGQLSRPALWTEHLLNSWSFYSSSAIAELSGPQSVRHYHASNTLYYI